MRRTGLGFLFETFVGRYSPSLTISSSYEGKMQERGRERGGGEGELCRGEWSEAPLKKKASGVRALAQVTEWRPSSAEAGRQTKVAWRRP